MSHTSNDTRRSLDLNSAVNSDLFEEISSEEQENVVGGLSIFDDFDELDLVFQRTDTSTFADNSVSGFNGLSSRSRTGYNQSQFTVGLNMRRDRRRGGFNSTFGRRGFLNFMLMLARLMWY